MWQLQPAATQTGDEALKAAGVPKDEQFILICPNVPFDAGYGEITTIFPSMRDWLFETVSYLLENTNRLVVVRGHPSEHHWWGGKEPVHRMLAEQGLSTNSRLIVIPGYAKVNTYRLMERCLFGVVFSSSTGLEMATQGKTVVVGSEVIYAHRGFTYDATNRDGYFNQIRTLLQGEAIELDKSKRQLSLLFYFVYHWVAQYPYPYDKPSGIARRPPKALVQSPAIDDFLPYLDLISMDVDEFKQAVPRYLDAESIQRRLETFH